MRGCMRHYLRETQNYSHLTPPVRAKDLLYEVNSILLSYSTVQAASHSRPYRRLLPPPSVLVGTLSAVPRSHTDFIAVSNCSAKTGDPRQHYRSSKPRSVSEFHRTFLAPSSWETCPLSSYISHKAIAALGTTLGTPST